MAIENEAKIVVETPGITAPRFSATNVYAMPIQEDTCEMAILLRTSIAQQQSLLFETEQNG